MGVKYSEIVLSYNSSDLLKRIASLQLLTQNHGKNYRLENLSEIVLENYNNNLESVSTTDLKQVLSEEYAESDHEDKPVNPFTDIIMFFEANYLVLPGITESGTHVLNKLLETIFASQEMGMLPKIFTDLVFSGVKLMLNLSDTVANRNGLTRYQFEKVNSKLLEFPADNEAEMLEMSLVFTEEWIIKQCKILGCNLEVINGLITQTPIEQHGEFDLCKKPLLKLHDKYIVAQPTSIVESLVYFIWQNAREHNCYDSLLNMYNGNVWRETQDLLWKMQWQPINIRMPEISSNLKCKENVYVFDLNKLAYVCFLESGFESTASTGDFSVLNEPTDTILTHGNLIEKRQEEVFHILKHFYPQHEFLTLYIISEVGFPQQYGFPESKKNQLSIYFRYTELKHIVVTEPNDPLLIWKFTRAYTESYENTDLVHLGGMLDVFAFYKTNGNSLLLRNQEGESVLVFTPGFSGDYVRKAILKRKEHIAPYPLNNEIVYTFVYNSYSFAPFYTEVGRDMPSSLLLEDFPVPIWFTNDQSDTHPVTLINSQLEMLAFWLYKMRSAISSLFKDFDPKVPFLIRIILDKKFETELRPGDVKVVPLEEIVISTEIKGSIVVLNIPVELVHWYAKPDNRAEHTVVLELLTTLLSIHDRADKRKEIQELMQSILPKGIAKMSSVLSNANGIQIETRNLPAYRPIQEYDLSWIDNNLAKISGVNVSYFDLTTIRGKSDLCSSIAAKLHDHLVDVLKQYDPEQLLCLLLSSNEACVQKRAVQALELPAKIACFGNESEEIFHLLAQEQDRIKMALAARCLIEWITAFNINSGKKIPSFDEVDHLIALMYSLISWANLSDGIRFKLYSPEIHVLKYGRIDVDYSEMNTVFFPHGLSRSKNEIYHHTKGYDDLLNVPINLSADYEISEELKKMEMAFISDWGIGLSKLQDFIIDISNFTRRKDKSVVGIEEALLYDLLKEQTRNWTDNEIKSALNVLTLRSNWQVGKPPEGFDKTDTYPWYYNRSLSFLRRPIAKLIIDNKAVYYWSYRHLWAALDNLLSLLITGALKEKEDGEIMKVVKGIITKKGKIFRDEVANWLKSNTNLEVIPFEVTIKPQGALQAEKDLGDIDVLAIDHLIKTIYAIECKNTVDSRSVHEMKTEIDKYLGRNGDTGLIQKHIERDKWLKENHSSLNLFTKTDASYSIRSLILTAAEIPLAYLKESELSLPFTSFDKLQITNGKVLVEIFEDV